MDTTSLDDLTEFINHVLELAEEHPSETKRVCVFIMGLIVTYRNIEKRIKFVFRTGYSLVWVHIGEEQYGFSYNPTRACMEIYKDSYTNEPIKTFNGVSNTFDIVEYFNDLSR